MYCGFLWRVRDCTAPELGTNRLYLVAVASDCNSTHISQHSPAVTFLKVHLYQADLNLATGYLTLHLTTTLPTPVTD